MRAESGSTSNHWTALILFAGILGLAGPAAAQGYLREGLVPDGSRILPPPPAPGSSMAEDDRRAFQKTRALKGAPRWDLAVNDNAQGAQSGLDDFACALGGRATAANAPVLASLFARVSADARHLVDPEKAHYARPRPFLKWRGDICVPRTTALEESPAYPSGHATLGWAWALILAELAPDRATEILMRGRSLGESRVVCGVHYPSDVEAGRTNGAVLAAALHGDAAFRADLDKARAEVAALRAASPGPASAACAIPDAAAGAAPY